LSTTPPDTGHWPREVNNAAAPDAAATPSSGAPQRRLGLALAVIATAQLMVVLDATIVNVALPHIQTALGFSGTNLEWVVNAYALAFGGFLLLGGRSGDLLGRRRIFIFGVLLFTLASLAGGFATSQAWQGSLRPARRDHRQPRPGPARLRAVQRRDHPERRFALG
jgi:Major Facilitator Superfamily